MALVAPRVLTALAVLASLALPDASAQPVTSALTGNWLDLSGAGPRADMDKRGARHGLDDGSDYDIQRRCAAGPALDANCRRLDDRLRRDTRRGDFRQTDPHRAARPNAQPAWPTATGFPPAGGHDPGVALPHSRCDFGAARGRC